MPYMAMNACVQPNSKRYQTLYMAWLYSSLQEERVVAHLRPWCGCGRDPMSTIAVVWQTANPCQGQALHPGFAAKPYSGIIGSADVLSVTIWLVPARKENIAVNVPPYLNAETTVLQDINDTGYFQASAQAQMLLHPPACSLHPAQIFEALYRAHCVGHLSRSECSCLWAVSSPQRRYVEGKCAGASHADDIFLDCRGCWARHMIGSLLGML